MPQQDDDLGIEVTDDVRIINDPEDTPDAVRDFMISNGVGKKYSFILKKVLPGGKVGTLYNISNTHLNINEIGKQYGPGEYVLAFSWKAPRPSGGRDNHFKDYEVFLPDHPWGDIHADHVRETNEERKKQDKLRLEKTMLDAQVTAVEQGKIPGVKSPFDTMKETLEMARSLGVQVGGAAPQPKPLDIMGIATFITALTPILQSVLGTKSGGADPALLEQIRGQNEMNKMLMEKLLRGSTEAPGSNAHMDKFMDMVTGNVGRMLEIKEMLQPEEKQGIMDRVFEAVDKYLPGILSMAQMAKEEREKQWGYKLAMANSDIKKIKDNPEMWPEMITKWDQEYGYQQTNGIITVAGITRPPELEGNKALFPSDGFGPDGNPLAAPSAPEAPNPAKESNTGA